VAVALTGVVAALIVVAFAGLLFIRNEVKERVITALGPLGSADSESLLTKMGNGFASALGVSVEGVAKGAGETVKDLGNALRNLLGNGSGNGK